MVIITYSLSNLPDSTKIVAELAHQVGIRVFAVAISTADPGELLVIAGGYSDRGFTTDWSNLSNMLGPLSSSVCAS